MSNHRRIVTACVATLGALLSACGGSSPHRPPTGVAGCNHMFSIGDAGTGVGLDWDSATHDYSRSAFVYACEAHQLGGIVTVRAPQHVSVTPQRARVNAPALLQFTVRVERGARGRLQFSFLDPDGGRFGEANQPEIVTADDGWRFSGP